METANVKRAPAGKDCNWDLWKEKHYFLYQEELGEFLLYERAKVWSQIPDKDVHFQALLTI